MMEDKFISFLINVVLMFETLIEHFIAIPNIHLFLWMVFTRKPSSLRSLHEKLGLHLFCHWMQHFFIGNIWWIMSNW